MPLLLSSDSLRIDAWSLDFMDEGGALHSDTPVVDLAGETPVQLELGAHHPGAYLLSAGVHGRSTALHLAVRGQPRDWAAAQRRLEGLGLACLAWSVPGHAPLGASTVNVEVLLPLTRPLGPAEHEELTIELTRAIPSAGVAAPEAAVLPHATRQGDGAEPFRWAQDGKVIDLEETLRLEQAWMGAADHYRRAQVTGTARKHWLATYARGLIRHRLPRVLFRAALGVENQIACVPPLMDEHVDRLIDEVWPLDPEDRSLLVAAATTEFGLAERVAYLHGQNVRFIDGERLSNKLASGWRVWTGQRWETDARTTVIQLVVDTARRTARIVSMLEPKTKFEAKQQERVKAWTASCESRGKIAASLDLLVASPGLAVKDEELDRDALLLNVRNGTLDLETGILRPHRREDYLTKLIEVEYDEHAKCPRWMQFLKETLPGDSLRNWFQRHIGYCLTGSVKEQVIFLWHGTGANGKSTALNVLQTLMGDYACVAQQSLFTNDTNTLAARPDIAMLRGVRLAIGREVPRNSAFAEGALKWLTGDDVLQARELFGSLFSFKPTFKPILCCNHLPRLGARDRGTWRRIRVVPWAVEIPEVEWDRNLGARLNRELPGILAWAVEGARRWTREGLAPESEIKRATEAYHERDDDLAEWLDAEISIDPDARTSLKALWEAWDAWNKASGNRKWYGRRGFARALDERGYVSSKPSGARTFHGLRLARVEGG